VEITPTVVKGYQTARLAAKAGPKTINDEVLLLLRLCGVLSASVRSRDGGLTLGSFAATARGC
jgi:hypothetical protein